MRPLDSACAIDLGKNLALFTQGILTRLPHGIPGALLLVGLLLFSARGVVVVSWACRVP